MTQQQGFKDPTGLTRWTRRFLYLQIVICLIALISGALEYQLLNDFKSGVYSSEAQAVKAAEASDSRQQVVGFVQFIIFVVSGVLILRWIHRANFNARQLGATDMRFTPGWCVGWYFIPIASLWKPYQAMKEIWKTSSTPKDWKSDPTPSLLDWWWSFWLLWSILGNASLRMSLKADDINEMMSANVVTLLSDVVGLPLSLVVLGLISRIHAMQMSHYQQRHETAASNSNR